MRIPVIILSLLISLAGHTQPYTHIEIHPDARHYTRMYDLYADHLVVMDKWDDSRDTLVKVIGFDAKAFLNSPAWSRLPDSISQKCTEPDENRWKRFIIILYAYGKEPKRIVLYQTWQYDFFSLANYINVLLAQKPEYKILYEFEKYKKMKENCK